MSISKFQNKDLNINKSYLTISLLGRNLKLNLTYSETKAIEINKHENSIDIIIPKKYKNVKNIDIVNICIQKLYSKVAETEIENAMETVRHLLKFAPDDYEIRRLSDGYYKCSKKKIVINPDIVQYNRDIINTTIIQAFCKTRYRINSENYKKLLNTSLNNYEMHKIKYNSNKNLFNLQVI